MNLPRMTLFSVLFALSACATSPHSPASSSAAPAPASDAKALEFQARTSYEKLIRENESAQALAEDAVAVMVFPRMFRAGFTFGGQYGEGVLLEDDRVAGYFNSVAASFGLQAGVQVYGYVLLITNDKALQFVKESKGWELGLGPSLVIADRGVGRSLTTTTIRSDIYAFVFDQKGLMAGSGLHGAKVSPIFRDQLQN